MGQALQGIKTAMVFYKNSCDTLWVLRGYPPSITRKRWPTQAGILKNYTRNIGTDFYVFIRCQIWKKFVLKVKLLTGNFMRCFLFNCLLVGCLNFPQRSRARMWQSAWFCFCFFLISFWNSILTYKILQNISKDISFSFANFFLEFFENFSMSKNNIILVKPAHQLWYPRLSSKSLSSKRGKLLTLL